MSKTKNRKTAAGVFLGVTAIMGAAGMVVEYNDTKALSNMQGDAATVSFPWYQGAIAECTRLAANNGGKVPFGSAVNLENAQPDGKLPERRVIANCHFVKAVADKQVWKAEVANWQQLNYEVEHKIGAFEFLREEKASKTAQSAQPSPK